MAGTRARAASAGNTAHFSKDQFHRIFAPSFARAFRDRDGTTGSGWCDRKNGISRSNIGTTNRTQGKAGGGSVVYHDNPDITEEQKLRVSCGLSVPDDTEVSGVRLPESGYQPDDRPCDELYHYDAEAKSKKDMVTIDIVALVCPLENNQQGSRGADPSRALRPSNTKACKSRDRPGNPSTPLRGRRFGGLPGG